MGEHGAVHRSVERALALAEPQGRVLMFLILPGCRELLQGHPVHAATHPGLLRLLID